MLGLILVSGGMLACDDDTPSKPIHQHEVASVTVQPSALTLSQGGAQLVTAAARCGCGSPLQESFAWTSGDPDVALVDPDGTIHGVGFGTTTVTATAEGIGAVVSVVVLPDGVIVGPAGGTVTFPDGSLQLEIPAGALATETDVVVERVADATFAGDPFYAPGTAFRLRPEGLLLQTRARLRIHYDPALLPDGVEPERLRLRIRDQDGWGDTWQHQHQHQIQRVEGEISRFGVFALVAVPEGQWVGPTGAVLTSADGLAEVDIPAGALTSWADVTLAAADAAEFAGDPLYLPGTAYRLEPDGLQLQERARLRIHYDPDGIPLGLTPDRLRLRERDRTHQQWTATPDNEVHGEQHRVQARIQRFGVFAVVAEPLGTVVGAEGGLVVAGDGAIEVLIPPGALEEAVDIVASPVDDALFVGEAGFVPGTGWELGPSGLQFQHEATVRIRFDPAHLPAGVTPERLRLRVRDHDQHTFRETVRSRLRLQEHKVEGEVSHFSVFALMAAPQGAGGVVSVTVSPAVVEVEPGSTVQMTAVVLDVFGNPVDAEITWTSSDPTIAVVDETGLVTGLAEGSVTITASAGGQQGSGGVNVKGRVPVASITVVPATLTLGVGQTGSLTAEARDVDGNLLAVDVDWSIGDRKVATIESSGRVTGVAEGTTTATARSGGVTGTATVVVTPPLSRLEIDDPGKEPLEVGLTKQLTATAWDPYGNVLSVAIQWASSDESMAVVDDTGLVTGVGRGVVTITASASGLSDTVEIRVVGESEEGTGNNLSWPVVFADGVGITGLPVTEDPGIRPTAAEGITVTAWPFFWEDNAPDYEGTYYTQQSFNTWAAQWLDGSQGAAVETTISWGDNLTHQTWSVSRPIRVEQVLTAPALTLTGFNMFYLYGQGPDEMQGTDGTTADFVPTVYTVGPVLTVERIDGPGGRVLGTVVEETVGSEVNVAGKVIYGYNLRLDTWTPPTGATLDGWYRLTFAIAQDGNVDLVAVGNEGEDLAYLPEVDRARNISWLEIFVKP